MKRKKELFNSLTSFSNLLLAFQKAYRGCSKAREAQKFHFYLETELFQLQRELRGQTYKPGNYRVFRIHDPKERSISVAPFRDRVVHHALVNIFEPIYEKSFIFDSFATRQGKGTHQAILRTQDFLKKNEWYLKADIRKFFDSVDHEILYFLLARKLKDKPLLALLRRIIFFSPLGKGLPIGNLTSQFLANVYLDALDHEIKDQLGIRFYVRYMDDFVFLSNQKESLLSLLSKAESFLWEKLKLQLKPKAVFLNRRSNGISFLGARIFPKYIRVQNKSLRRSLKKIKVFHQDWMKGKCTEDRFVDSLISVHGHLAFFDSFRLRSSLGPAWIWLEPSPSGGQLEQQSAEPAVR